jgi:hypothetical protein
LPCRFTPFNILGLTILVLILKFNLGNCHNISLDGFARRKPYYLITQKDETEIRKTIRFNPNRDLFNFYCNDCNENDEFTRLANRNDFWNRNRS